MNNILITHIERPRPPRNRWSCDGYLYLFDVRSDDPKADRRTAEDLGEIPMRLYRLVYKIIRGMFI